MKTNATGQATLSREVAGRVDEISDRFEQAWRRGECPRIENFLPRSEAEREAVLVELVHVELECRLDAGETPRVETYFERFRELENDASFALELISAEYALRCRRQESVSVDEYLHRFPARAAALKARLTDMAGEDRGKPATMWLNCPHCREPIRLSEAETCDEACCPTCGSRFQIDRHHELVDDERPLPRLDNFELLERVGSGAFGTVYRAHDEQLDRVVAIKVPRAYWIADNDEDRFIREARSVAQLHHAGIVRVFAVGHSGGFPYIVTEYVEGVTLADALSRRRFTFREVAELVASAADALAHAHERGIVHRDLKPSNIMLAGDGTPRIMDFGLAKRDAAEVTVTLEGQLLGTPAYMSPEQAGGGAHRVDGRSDIYSLGVILYELICGELPFRGSVRMLLHQVIHDSPRSPRSLNERIPRDLETICLKCLEKEPPRRYAAASEVAADLRRFLSEEPIRARPVGSAERALRWARRNRLVAGVGAAAVLVLVAVSIGSTIAAMMISSSRNTAVTERRRADQNARLERVSRADAERNLANAERERLRAEENFRLANEAVDEYLTKVSENRLLNVAGLQPLRKELLESALSYYRQFIEQRKDDPLMQSKLASAYSRVGNITRLIGSKTEAVDAHNTALAIHKQLVAQDPQDVAFQRALAINYHHLGRAQLEAGQYPDAESSYQQAIRMLERLTSEDGDRADYRDPLGTAYNNLGRLHQNTGRRPEAEEAFKSALSVQERLVEENLDSAPHRENLAATYNNFGIVLKNTGRWEEAEQTYRKAYEIHEALLAQYPDVPNYQHAVVVTARNLGFTYIGSARWSDAIGYYQRAIEIGETLVAQNPTVTYYEDSLGTALGSLARAWAMTATGDPQQSVEYVTRAMAASAHKSMSYRSTLGGALYRDGRYAEAKKTLRGAMSLHTIGLRAKNLPADEVRFDAAMARLFLAMTELQLGEPDEAGKWLDDAARWINELENPTTSGENGRSSGPMYAAALQPLRSEATALVEAAGQ